MQPWLNWLNWLNDFLQDRRAKDRATAMQNARNLLWDGYQFCQRERWQQPDRFVASRLGELGPTEEIVGSVDVIHPLGVDGNPNKPDYVVICIRNDETGEVRYVCPCRFWQREWGAMRSALHSRMPGANAACVGWCKHTKALEMLIAAAVPLRDLVGIAASPTWGQREAEYRRRQQTQERSGRWEYPADDPLGGFEEWRGEALINGSVNGSVNGSADGTNPNRVIGASPDFSAGLFTDGGISFWRAGKVGSN